MKRYLLIMSLLLNILFAQSTTNNNSYSNENKTNSPTPEITTNENQYSNKTFTLKDFYYEEDILSNETYNSNVIYIPINIEYLEKTGNKLILKFKKSDKLASNSTLNVLVNNFPVKSFNLDNIQDSIEVELPYDLLVKEDDILKLEIGMTLYKQDQEKCYLENQKDMWVSLSNNSEIVLNYKKDINPSIIDYLKNRVLEKKIYLYSPRIYDDSIEIAKEVAKFSNILGYYSSSLKRDIILTGEVQNEGTTITLNDRNFVTLDTKIEDLHEAKKLFKDMVFEVGDNQRLTVYEDNNYDVDEDINSISLEEIGIGTIERSFVSGEEINLVYNIDAFGGVPNNLEFNLKFKLRGMSLSTEGKILLYNNDLLIGSNKLKDTAEDYEMTFNIENVEAINNLRIEIVTDNNKLRGECALDAIVSKIKIDSKSRFNFTGLNKFKTEKISDFPYSLYGKTLIVISRNNKNVNELISKISYQKGKNNYNANDIDVVEFNEFLANKEKYNKYDSLAFILRRSDVEKIDPSLQVKDNFKVENNLTNEVIFNSSVEGKLVIAKVLNYNSKPGILLTTKGSEQAYEYIDEKFLDQMSAVYGEVLIADGTGIYSINLKNYDIKPSIVEKSQTLWKRYGQIFALVIFIIGILFLIFSKKGSATKK